MEGIEVIVDFNKKFKELGYSKIENFQESFPSETKHFYWHKISLGLSEIYERLIRKN